MKRRDFFTSSLAAASAAGLASAIKSSAAEGAAHAAREFYELRLYHLRRGPKQKLWEDFSAIPAMNRQGIGPVGVFSVMIGPDNPTTYVLLPHKSLESFATVKDRVHADP